MRAVESKITFLEQVSPEACECTRCDRLGRKTIIAPGERHFAMLEQGSEDEPPRIILCEACRRFIRSSITHGRRRR